jgi:serine/threonine protein kinase
MEDNRMERSPNLGTLRSGDWQRLQDWVERFEDAWQGADTVDLEKFLPSAEDALRVTVLAELVKSELEIRCRRGQAVRLDAYLERFPELTRAPDLLPRLLYEEYRVRQMHGDRPALTTYQLRFPDHYGELQKLASAQPVKASVSSKFLAAGGGYNLIKRIGSGGFGEVWLAEAPGGIKAAVKILFRPADHEEAQRELSALELIKEMRHPFLLQTQAYWTTEDRIYVVMELADGSLRDRLKECRQAGAGGVPLAEMLQYFREAADALDFLHDRHVQHRDIKPENILLLQRHAKVADFGLARSQDSRRMVTASGSGTPFYMAPEVWRGRSSIHSDQYSLAVTYAELRLDRRIFSSRELAQLMYDHMQATPDLAPLPEPEQAVLRKALAKEPEERYPSCGVFVRELVEQMADELGRTDPDLAILPARAMQRSRSSSGSTLEALATIRPGQGNTPSALVDVTEKLEEAPSPDRQRGKRQSLWLPLAGLAVVMLAGLAVAFWPRTQTWLPPGEGWQAVSTSGEKTHGWFFADRIARTIDGEQVGFICIRKRPGTDDPPTFYLMEDKVWVGLYRAFVKDDVKDRTWETLANQHNNERFPVYGVPVDEAHRFAVWLGGKLPTRAQWDKAAGRFEQGASEQSGPFEGPWGPGDIAIDRDDPMAVGAARKDRSRFGVRDMAGNGREWTREVTGNLQVPLTNPDRFARVYLRGRGYQDPEPLRFEQLKDHERSARYVPDPKETMDISFRVVVEIEF